MPVHRIRPVQPCAEVLQRFVKPFCLTENDAEIVVQRRKLRLELQRVAKVLDGFLVSSQYLECKTDVTKRFPTPGR